LQEAGLQASDLDLIAFYDKPYLKFERLLETYHSFAPNGLKSFLSAAPVWVKEKMFMRKMIWDELEQLDPQVKSKKPKLLFPEHHLSHAASAFYPSPFKDAAILTVDGVGEWATTTIGAGRGNQIEILQELPFPHSIRNINQARAGRYQGRRFDHPEYGLLRLRNRPAHVQRREVARAVRPAPP
jgi:carbamoyltransferase